MKMSTLVGAPAGSAVIRNGMCWHGAVSDPTNPASSCFLPACPERTRDDLTSVLLAQTPNLSDEVRILPSIEYGGFPGTPKTMPYEQWEKLSVRSQTDSAPISNTLMSFILGSLVLRLDPFVAGLAPSPSSLKSDG